MSSALSGKINSKETPATVLVAGVIFNYSLPKWI